MSDEWRVASGEIRRYRDLLVWQKAIAWVAQRLTYLSEAVLSSLLDPADEISRMLAGLITKLEERRK